jgi:hypothetical protein
MANKKTKVTKNKIHQEIKAYVQEHYHEWPYMDFGTALAIQINNWKDWAITNHKADIDTAQTVRLQTIAAKIKEGK